MMMMMRVLSAWLDWFFYGFFVAGGGATAFYVAHKFHIVCIGGC